MGRRKLFLKKIDNPASRYITYSKRREGLIKKAKELSVLCGIDVGLLMFSPKGRMTAFASTGRIEDIILEYIEQPRELKEGLVENEEFLCRIIKHLKLEAEMLEKISKIEVLEQELVELNSQKEEKKEKMRSYIPDVGKINTLHEAYLMQSFLTNAIRRVQHYLKVLLENKTKQREYVNVEEPTVVVKDPNFVVEKYVNSITNRNTSFEEEEEDEEACLPLGPHLSIGYLRAQKNWNLQFDGESLIRI